MSLSLSGILLKCPSVGILSKQHFSQTGQLGMEALLESFRGTGMDLFVNNADKMSANVAVMLSFVLISLKTHLVKY